MLVHPESAIRGEAKAIEVNADAKADMGVVGR
jgi:hypothetical protein